MVRMVRGKRTRGLTQESGNVGIWPLAAVPISTPCQCVALSDMG